MTQVATGIAGLLLAAAMLEVGVLAALHSFHVAAAAGHAAQAGPFLISPISTMLFSAGPWRSRRRTCAARRSTSG